MRREPELVIVNRNAVLAKITVADRRQMYGIHGDVHHIGISASCMSSSTERSGFKTAMHRGAAAVLAPAIDTDMILTAAEILDSAIGELAPDVQAIVTEHFFDGASVYKIQRQRRMRKVEVEACITTALNEIKAYMFRRGVRASADVL
jgi:hypothetical protein